ncbi:hypothetical protein VTK73DRAFT_2972 [Phialemonium thermophilum]|uniref:Uncharacterized protein n=1 Tax=Phialemonium thermophilum TaxID=223376 RepID=A0ABR3VNB0_9PEZI
MGVARAKRLHRKPERFLSTRRARCVAFLLSWAHGEPVRPPPQHHEASTRAQGLPSLVLLVHFHHLPCLYSEIYVIQRRESPRSRASTTKPTPPHVHFFLYGCPSAHAPAHRLPSCQR